MMSGWIGLARTAHHEVIAVDHFRPPADAEDGHHVRRGTALDLVGLLGVVGDEAAADLMGVGAAHHHGIAAGELAVDPDHAAGSRLLPARSALTAPASMV